MYDPGIEAFIAVVRTLNVSKAAHQLRLSQSTVSKRLKDLEQTLGFALIERGQGAKSLRLTPEGEEFLRIAQRWNSLCHEALSLKNDKRNLSLSIGSLNSLNYALFPPLFRALSQHRPKLRLRVTTLHSPELYDLVEHKQADVAFTLVERTYPSIVVEKCYSEPMVLLRPGQDNTSEPTFVHPRDLDPNHELFLVSGLSYKLWHDQWWDPLNTNYIHLDNAQLVFSFLFSEEQWAIVPLSVAEMARKQSPFRIYRLSEEPPERVIYKITHKYPKASTLASLELLDHYLKIYLPQGSPATDSGMVD